MNDHHTGWGEQRGFPVRSAGDVLDEPKIDDDKISRKIIGIQSCSAEQIYNLRRKRDRLFNDGLFSDPAWDILLDLYISEKDGKKICITSACIAAGVPASTGLRWIAILVQNGYVERHEDPADARRSLVGLTDTARTALQGLFENPDA